MHDANHMPQDLASCWAIIQAQADTNAQQALLLAEQSASLASQAQKIEELTAEMEKLRKLLSHFVNGHTSEN